jgi:hypothetical protein
MYTLTKELSPAKVNGSKFEFPSPVHKTEGYYKAEMVAGNIIVLQDNLNARYREYTENVEKSDQHSDPIKLPYLNSNDNLQRENVSLSEINRKMKSETIPYSEQQIEQLKKSIADIRSNPKEYLGEKTDKISFYIGATILVLLTCFLVIFYSSASYSGFFRVFEPGVNLREAMLDPNTFIKAVKDGIGELLFILLMPFIFLALGYLIHKFIEKKSLVSYLKVFLLLIVAFAFDSFLAYKITEGMESVNQTILSEEYTVGKALIDVNFWVVIFSGFVSYIVWGLVFDFVMKAYQILDKMGTIIKLKNDKISEFEETIYAKQKEIDDNEKMINKNRIEMSKNDEIIVKPIVSIEAVRRIHHEFMVGWKQYQIATNMSVEIIKEADKIANHCLENFIYNLTKTY